MKKNNKDFNILEHYLGELVFGVIFVVISIFLGFNEGINFKNDFLMIIILIVVFLGIPFVPILFKKFFRK